ncbi:MAG: hypothetical protein ACLUNO_05715 [Oscillospiraceae bacterium]
MQTAGAHADDPRRTPRRRSILPPMPTPEPEPEPTPEPSTEPTPTHVAGDNVRTGALPRLTRGGADAYNSIINDLTPFEHEEEHRMRTHHALQPRTPEQSAYSTGHRDGKRFLKLYRSYLHGTLAATA